MGLLEYGTITLSDVSRSTGVSLSHVSRIMSGQRKPSLDVASKIAAYLGVSIEELMHMLDACGGGQLPPTYIS